MHETTIAGPAGALAVADFGLQAMPEDVRGFLIAVMDSIDADLAALSQRNPLAGVALVPEAGHMVHLEATEAVAGHVSAFVAQL